MLLFLFLLFLLPPFPSHLFIQFSYSLSLSFHHTKFPCFILISFTHSSLFSFFYFFLFFFQPYSFLLFFIFFDTVFFSSFLLIVFLSPSLSNFLFSSIVSALSLQAMRSCQLQQLQDFNIIIPILKCMLLVILTMALSVQFLENYQSS